MRTKRQPTIKTLLLVTVVVAIQCAGMSVTINGNTVLSEVPAFIRPLFVTGILFWSALPLAIALFARSEGRATAVGFGFGLMSMPAVFYFMKLDWFDPTYVKFALLGILRGPFECLAPIRVLWWNTNANPMPMPIEIAMYSVWLIIYTATCFLIAKSCRLREQSA